jgi:hypothetical protein
VYVENTQALKIEIILLKLTVSFNVWQLININMQFIFHVFAKIANYHLPSNTIESAQSGCGTRGFDLAFLFSKFSIKKKPLEAVFAMK